MLPMLVNIWQIYIKNYKGALFMVHSVVGNQSVMLSCNLLDFCFC